MSMKHPLTKRAIADLIDDALVTCGFNCRVVQAMDADVPLKLIVTRPSEPASITVLVEHATDRSS
jgi:hypothetical protein